jgi:hypothetical protein
LKFGPDGSTKTGSTDDTITGTPLASAYATGNPPVSGAEEAMLYMADAAGIPAVYVSEIQRGSRKTPAEMMPLIPQLAINYQGNPNWTVGQLASSVGVSTQGSNAAQNLETTSQATAGGGLESDVFGSLFEVAYPFIMFGFAGLAFAMFIAIAIVAVAKSPAGQSVTAGLGRLA